MTFTGPSSGSYSFAIANDTGELGVGSTGTVTIDASSYNFLVQDANSIDLSHLISATPPVRIEDGLLQK